MKFFGPHIYISKAQRNALIVLVVLLLIFSFFKDYLKVPRRIQWDEQLMVQYQKWIDSTAKSRAEKSNFYPFNPNYLSDYRAYILGMEIYSIDRLMAYRKSGKWIQSAEEFKSVTGIEDTLMASIGPYLIFPKSKKISVQKSKNFSKIGLNRCQASDLKTIYGVGEKLSRRIIKYRKYLRGFSDMDQLYEVFGLDSSVVERIQKRFEIKVLPQIKKRDLDTVSLDYLVKLPYLTAIDAQKIIRLRSYKRKLGFDDLEKIEGFDSLKIERISLYLRTF